MLFQASSSAFPWRTVFCESGTEPLAGEFDRPAAKSRNISPVALFVAEAPMLGAVINPKRWLSAARGSF